MDEYGGGGGGGGVGAIIGMLVGLICGLGIYVFFCFCLKKICEKVGRDPGFLIGIPIVQLLPLLEIAGLPTWHIVLFFIPLVGAIYQFFFWWKIAEARGKPGAMGLLVPLCAPVGLPFLAFSA